MIETLHWFAPDDFDTYDAYDELGDDDFDQYDDDYEDYAAEADARADFEAGWCGC